MWRPANAPAIGIPRSSPSVANAWVTSGRPSAVQIHVERGIRNKTERKKAVHAQQNEVPQTIILAAPVWAFGDVVCFIGVTIYGI